MKNICKIAVLFAAVLMLFCVTGCGDNAGGSPSGGTQTQTPSEPTIQETPLTLEAINAGTITLSNPGCMTNLRYKKNGGNFVNVTASTNTITVASGDKVAFYADGSENTVDEDTDEVTAFCIGCNSDCYVYGNVMSLLSSSNFKNATSISAEFAFAKLFNENTHIKNHTQKALVLPATTLAFGCYAAMFYGCTSLTSAPALPATTLVSSCYASMFRGCTGLTSAPALPAMTMTMNCYYCMFYGCTGLTSTPVLPATTLAEYCYKEMFKGCSNLNTVICLATNNSATDCTTDWLDGVASTGTFYKSVAVASENFWSGKYPSSWGNPHTYSAQ